MIFIETHVFARRLERLAGVSSDEVLARIQQDLLRDPERGDLVRGTGGLRKARVRNPKRQKGTSGGFRYLYLSLARQQQIYLAYILDKDEQEDLSQFERRLLADIVAEIKSE